MKKIAYIIFSTIIISCSNQTTEIQIFGNQEMTEEGKITTKELLQTLSVQDSAFVKVEAVINSICQKKGCWMYVDLGDENEMLVRFKDYGFFVPKSGIEGKKILMSGKIFRDTISVERLRHYAEDAKRSEEEIAQIVSPEFKINMIANGVAIREN